MSPFDADLIDLKTARELMPTRPDLGLLWRWAVRGVRGVQLDHVRIGRRLYTTKAALESFCEAMRSLGSESNAQHAAPKAPRRSAARAGRRESEIESADERFKSLTANAA